MPIWAETGLRLIGLVALFAPLLLIATALRRSDGPVPGWVAVVSATAFGASLYAAAGAALGWWGWPLGWPTLLAALVFCALFTVEQDPGHRWSAYLVAVGWTLAAAQAGLVLGHAAGAPLTGWRSWGAALLMTGLCAATLLLRHGVPAGARAAGLGLLLVLVAAAGWSPLPVGDVGVPRWLLLGVGWVIAAVAVSLLGRTEVAGQPAAPGGR